MTQKRIGYYSSTQTPAFFTAADQLIIEIGAYQVVCLIKSAVTNEPEAFEIFQIDTTTRDWSDVLADIKTSSALLNRHYNTTRVYYNFSETLIVPESKFSIAAGRDYLDQVYGENPNDHVAYAKLLTDTSMIAVYRVKASVSEWVSRQFPSHQLNHIYSEILNKLLTKSLPDGYFTSLRFYSKHLIATVFKDKKLQLIQSFSYQSDEDILYYLLSIIKQLELNPEFSQAEISGELSKQSSLAKQLPDLFANINWDNSGNGGVFSTVIKDHPAHYFTPYFKLA
jgi:hypothetical protein